MRSGSDGRHFDSLGIYNSNSQQSEFNRVNNHFSKLRKQFASADHEDEHDLATVMLAEQAIQRGKN